MNFGEEKQINMNKNTQKRLVLMNGEELKNIMKEEMLVALTENVEIPSANEDLSDMPVMDIEVPAFKNLIRNLALDFISRACANERKKLIHEQNQDKKLIDGLISREQMAKELKISLPTLRKWTVNRIIPNHVKLGGVVLYNRQEVVDFLKNKNSKNGI
jgi:hypothetical protein